MLKIEYNKKYSDNTVWKKYKIISCTEFDGFMQFFLLVIMRFLRCIDG